MNMNNNKKLEDKYKMMLWSLTRDVQACSGQPDGSWRKAIINNLSEDTPLFKQMKRNLPGRSSDTQVEEEVPRPSFCCTM